MHRTLQRALAVGTTAALALSALTASPRTHRQRRRAEPDQGRQLGLIGDSSGASVKATIPHLIKVRDRWRPRQDSNLRTRLRRAALYPLSYGGPGPSDRPRL